MSNFMLVFKPSMRYRIHLHLLLLFCVLSSEALQAQEGGSLSVVVRASKLRSAPDHWSVIKGELVYGDTLTQLSTQGAWINVNVSSGAGLAGQQGYVHQSAVSARKVILQGAVQLQDLNVDPANIVLAGKGFNADVEGLYRSNQDQVDFAAVDRWEQQSVSDSQLRLFLQQGGLAK